MMSSTSLQMLKIKEAESARYSDLDLVLGCLSRTEITSVMIVCFKTAMAVVQFELRDKLQNYI